MWRWPKVITQEWVSERVVEQIVDIPIPQIVEEIVEAIRLVLQERIVQEIVDVPVPQIMEEILEVVRVMSQDARHKSGTLVDTLKAAEGSNDYRFDGH